MNKTDARAIFPKEEQSWLWPGVSVLVLAGSFTAVSLTGWPWAWGLIPAGDPAAFMVAPAAAFCTILILAAVTGKTGWLNWNISFPGFLGARWSGRRGPFLSICRSRINLVGHPRRGLVSALAQPFHGGRLGLDQDR